MFPGDLQFPSQCNQRTEVAPTLEAPKLPPWINPRCEGDIALRLAQPRSRVQGLRTAHHDWQPHWKHMEKGRAVPTKEIRVLRRQKHSVAIVLFPRGKNPNRAKGPRREGSQCGLRRASTLHRRQSNSCSQGNAFVIFRSTLIRGSMILPS